VRFQEQIAIVTVDSARLDEQALVQVLNKAGYGAKVIKK
jgi:copper chaperone CopZ